jgi:hypothetical protein
MGLPKEKPQKSRFSVLKNEKRIEMHFLFFFLIFSNLYACTNHLKPKKPPIFRLNAFVVGVAVKSSNFFKGGFRVD